MLKLVETQTCRIPYFSSMSRKLYSLAWAGLGKVPGGGLTCDAPVVGGPGTTAIPPDSYGNAHTHIII